MKNAVASRLASQALSILGAAVAFSVSVSRADDDAASAEKALASWDELSIAVIIFPGCTEPHIESVTIDRSKGTIIYTVDEIGREPKKTRVTQTKINQALMRSISKSLLKHYRVAVSEKSITERLDELGDNETAKTSLKKKFPPGIGGYSMEMMVVTAHLATKKYRLDEEFSGGMDEFVKWLRTLPEVKQPDTRR